MPEPEQPENAVYPLETVFLLNKEEILQYVSAEKFPETAVAVPAEVMGTYRDLYLLTGITVYNKEKLLMDESGLTMPLELADLSKLRPEEIKFHYHAGSKPEMKFSMRTITVNS